MQAIAESEAEVRVCRCVCVASQLVLLALHLVIRDIHAAKFFFLPKPSLTSALAGFPWPSHIRQEIGLMLKGTHTTPSDTCLRCAKSQHTAQSQIWSRCREERWGSTSSPHRDQRSYWFVFNDNMALLFYRHHQKDLNTVSFELHVDVHWRAHVCLRCTLSIMLSHLSLLYVYLR